MRWDDDVLEVAYEAIRQGIPAEARESAFEAVRETMPEEYQGWSAPFGDVVEVPDDAPLIDRLVAWNGRTPGPASES